jgi:hypothetical protein
MACEPPYSVAPGYSPASEYATTLMGSRGLPYNDIYNNIRFCYCNEISSCESPIFGYVGGLYTQQWQLYETGINCCTPCATIWDYEPIETYPYYGPLYQCASQIVPYGALTTNTFPYTRTLWFDDVSPLTGGISVFSRNWYEQGTVSVLFDLTDICCANSYNPNGYYSYYIAAKSGKIKISMGAWIFGNVWPYIYRDPPESLTETGYIELPPRAGSEEALNCGYWIAPFESQCYYSDLYGLSPQCKLTEGNVYAAVSVFVTSLQNCTQIRYVGYDEIELQAGDRFYFQLNFLPLSIPSFATFNGNSTPSQTLPFMVECSETSDCSSYSYIGTVNCRTANYYGYGNGNDYGNYSSFGNPQLKKACTGSYPISLSMRKRMLEKQVLSRIKKVHYKP